MVSGVRKGCSQKLTGISLSCHTLTISRTMLDDISCSIVGGSMVRSNTLANHPARPCPLTDVTGWCATHSSAMRAYMCVCDGPACWYEKWALGTHPSEKAMAPHSSTLTWKIPWTEEPGRLQSMGSRRIGHDWATSLSFFTFMHWRRKWQPTPVFLPGESQWWGRGGLVGCHLWGHTELDTTEATQQQQQQQQGPIDTSNLGRKRRRWEMWVEWSCRSSH